MLSDSPDHLARRHFCRSRLKANILVTSSSVGDGVEEGLEGGEVEPEEVAVLRGDVAGGLDLLQGEVVR